MQSVRYNLALYIVSIIALILRFFAVSPGERGVMIRSTPRSKRNFR